MPLDPPLGDRPGWVQSVLDELGAVTERLDKLQERGGYLDRLNKRSLRTRLMTWATGALLVVDLLVTGNVVLNDISAQSSCAATNKVRAENRQLWDYVVSLFPETPQGQTILANVREHIDAATAPERCASWEHI